MQHYLVFLFFLLAFPLLGQRSYYANFHNPNKRVEVRLGESSYIVINGKTNVNKFHCYYHQLSTEPLPIVLNQLSDSIAVKNAKLVLQIHQFDCKNQMMNKDFQQLLQSEAYPQIEIQIQNLHKLPKSDSKLLSQPDDEQVTVWVEAMFRIVGNEHHYSFPVKITDKTEKSVCLQGVVDLNLFDFGIQPPTKLLGLIEVQELITIDFFAKLIVSHP